MSEYDIKELKNSIYLELKEDEEAKKIFSKDENLLNLIDLFINTLLYPIEKKELDLDFLEKTPKTIFKILYSYTDREERNKDIYYAAFQIEQFSKKIIYMRNPKEYKKLFMDIKPFNKKESTYEKAINNALANNDDKDNENLKRMIDELKSLQTENREERNTKGHKAAILSNLNIYRYLKNSFIIALVIVKNNQRILQSKIRQEDKLDFYNASIKNKIKNEEIIDLSFESNIESGVFKFSKIEGLVKLIEYIKRSKKGIILVGQSGSGKTTTLKYIESHFSSKETGKCPIYLSLTNIPLLNQNDIKRIISNELKINENNTEFYLDEGKFIFLFDGLNEILSKNREILFSQIVDLIRHYRKNTFIVTTREEYGIKLDNSFEKIWIEDLLNSDRDIEKTKKYCKKEFPEKNYEIDIIFADPSSRDILKTPMILKLMLQIRLNNNDLENEVIIIKKYIKAIIDRENAEKHKNINFIDFRNILSYIALLTKSKHGIRPIPENEISNLFYKSREFIKHNLNLSEFLNTSLQLNIMYINNNDEIGFKHELLQDYFTAEALANGILEKSDEIIVKELENNDYEWERVYIYYSNLIDKKSRILLIRDILENKVITLSERYKIALDCYLMDIKRDLELKEILIKESSKLLSTDDQDTGIKCLCRLEEYDIVWNKIENLNIPNEIIIGIIYDFSNNSEIEQLEQIISNIIYQGKMDILQGILSTYYYDEIKQEEIIDIIIKKVENSYIYNLAIFAKANSLYRQSKFEKAIEYYNQFTELESEDKEGWLMRGNNFLSLKNYNEALSSYNNSLRIIGDIDYLKSEDENLDIIMCMDSLIYCNLHLGKCKDALELAERLKKGVLKGILFSSTILELLEETFSYCDEHKHIFEIYEYFKKQNSTMFSGYFNNIYIGRTNDYFKTEDIEKCLQYCNEKLTFLCSDDLKDLLQPSLLKAEKEKLITLKADCFYILNKFDEALEIYNKINPHEKYLKQNIIFAKGRTLLELGNIEDGLLCLDNALKIGSSFIKSKTALEKIKIIEKNAKKKETELLKKELVDILIFNILEEERRLFEHTDEFTLSSFKQLFLFIYECQKVVLKEQYPSFIETVNGIIGKLKREFHIEEISSEWLKNRDYLI